MFGNLIAVTLGDLHPLTQSYWAFWIMFNDAMKEKIFDFIDQRGWLKPVHILRKVHVEMHQWLNAWRMNAIPMDPDFQMILGKLARAKFTLPQLPYSPYLIVYGGG